MFSVILVDVWTQVNTREFVWMF